MSYAELCAMSNFTFLTGASHPEELVLRAAELGLSAIAIADRNSLAGVVRAHAALREMARSAAEIRSQRTTDSCSRQVVTQSGPLQADPAALPQLIIGARLVLEDSRVEWVALPTDRAAYARLSRMLSIGKGRAEKGACRLRRLDLLAWGEGLILIALPPDPPRLRDRRDIRRIAETFPGQVYLGAVPRYDGRDRARFQALAASPGPAMVAVGDVLMHRAARRSLADVLTCLREKITIDRIGLKALPNAERRLKSPAEMAKIFAGHPKALARTQQIAARCRFSLDELSYEYPDEITDGEPPQARLERLTRAGLARRFPAGVEPETQEKVEKELKLVAELGYAAYFLTVHDIVQFARDEGILCQGRGSAANSVICYALEITAAPPGLSAMVFERFISKARGEPPDIDVDFEHERREEVIQHIYAKYGRHRAGLTATVIHFRARAAIRDVGKVMGLSADMLAAIAGLEWGWSARSPDPARLRTLGLDPTDRRLALTLRLIGEIIGFPRHLSQHVGGFVITRDRLDALCPIGPASMEGRSTIEWDKDDIEALRILKVDVLGLGMLTCLRKCFELVAQHEGRRLSIPAIPQDCERTYDMLCRADAIGVFQVESRAQMNFLPRMRPRCLYDLVIEVAIVRPGPIQGGMVHPYIKRRRGIEDVDYPSDELRAVLGRTLGVPLFQEQALQIAVVAAGFTPDEADQLRRSLATFRRMGAISSFRDKFVGGMRARGYEADFAERCFSQIEGFGEYGFPESHAASFAILVYASAWLKCWRPAAFACALLNSQPMGFYAPAQILRDARAHDIELRPISINHSHWDCTLERAGGAMALRLGFRQIKGMSEEDAGWIVAARGNGYPDVETVWLRAGLHPRALTRLAEADAFACIGLTRREALWRAKAIRSPRPLPLFADPIDGEGIVEPAPQLPRMGQGEEVIEDYIATRLSLRAHPMALLRSQLGRLTRHDLLLDASGRVTVCGLVIARQRPGTASGVIFLTLEDEAGVANIIVWNRIYQRFRSAVIGGRLLRVRGRIQKEGQVVHILAERIEDVSDMLRTLGDPRGPQIDPTQGRADEGRRPVASRGPRHPRDQAKTLFPSRDFH